MNKPTVVRVLDARNEEDRKYAKENLIGCWVGYGGTRSYAAMISASLLIGFDEAGFVVGDESSCNSGFRYITEFSNSRHRPIEPRCEKCGIDLSEICDDCLESGFHESLNALAKEEQSPKTSPKFYCAANIDEVPEDAVGKEWEFSNNGVDWIKDILKGFIKNEVKIHSVSLGGKVSTQSYMFNQGYAFSPEGRAPARFMRPVQGKLVKRMSRKQICEELAKHTDAPFKICADLKNDEPLYVRHELFMERAALGFLSNKLNREVVIDE